MNSNNKPCNADRNELVFAEGEIDTSASNSRYSDAEDKDDRQQIELNKWILNAIELQVYKNNLLVAGRIAKKEAKNAQVFKEGWIVTLAIPAKMQ